MKCSECKYWNPFLDHNPQLKIGVCRKMIYINYMTYPAEADKEISNESAGGHNVYSNENFGCINFVQKENNGN